MLEEDGQICASMILNRHQAEAYAEMDWQYPAPPEQVLVIHTLTMPPEMSGKGYGTRMVRFAMEEARRMGCKVIRLDTYVGNLPAQRLYGKLGFRGDFGPVQFVEVRQAIAYCMDRATFAKDFTGGFGGVVDGPYYTGSWMYKAAVADGMMLDAYATSADSAIAVLEQGGWVYNADGSDYAGTGVRYKKIPAAEIQEQDITFQSKDGAYKTEKVGDDYYMPLVLNWYGTSNNEFTDLLVTGGDGSRGSNLLLGFDFLGGGEQLGGDGFDSLLDAALQAQRISAGSNVAQAFLDQWMKNHPETTLDYIHGEDAVQELVKGEKAVGFLLPAPDKSDLFTTVIREGAMPRKSFSMGEAHEKRYYMECRSLR